MKKYILLLLIITPYSILQAQVSPRISAEVQGLFKDKPEIYFSFPNPGRSKLVQIGSYLSLDHNPVRDGVVYAYANTSTLLRFLEEGIPYEVHTSPGEIYQPLMKSLKDFDFSKLDTSSVCSMNWNFFPTYPAYEALLQQFQHDFPLFCKIDTIAELESGKRILVAHLGDNLEEDDDEPEFLYTSSMHGDETTGYNLLLHLIAYLLCNNETDSAVTRLLQEVDIYINPLANPDGAYAGGNTSVRGATRSNGSGFDLNRNFPDPDDGEFPGGTRQPETTAFMEFAAEHNFNISANLHGGAEVANYPWDTYFKRHPDDAWWQYVCRNYANSAQADGPAGFFNDLNNGITNGYDWYIISGGRQDYMNTYEYCREFTLELSQTKNLPGSTLETYWDYHKDALLEYMEESLNGVRGTVVDSITRQALEARVFISAHDNDSSHVYSSMPVGNYHRYLAEASYSLTFSAAGYLPKTIDNVQIQNGMATRLDVELVQEVVAGLGDRLPRLAFSLHPNPASSQLEVVLPETIGAGDLNVLDLTGRILLQQTLRNQSSATLNIAHLAKGLYLVQVRSAIGQGTYKFLKN